MAVKKREGAIHLYSICFTGLQLSLMQFMVTNIYFALCFNFAIAFWY